MSNQSVYQPTFPHLRSFVAVAHHQHFGAAAQSLGVSQPSLSQSLSSLEAGLQRSLIERSTRRVIVTKEGQALLPYAEAVIDTVEKFQQATEGLDRGLEGDLSIGFIPTAAPYILPQFLQEADKQFVNLSLTVFEDQTARLLETLRTGGLDIAILALPLREAGFRTIPVYEEPFVAAVPTGHPWSGRDDLTVEELKEAPLLLLDEGHCLRDQTLDLCQSVGVKVNKSNTRATSLSTILQCVSAGMGVTLIPESAIPVEQNMQGISIARFGGKTPGRTMGIVYRSSSSRGQDFEAIGALLKTSYLNAIHRAH